MPLLLVAEGGLILRILQTLRNLRRRAIDTAIQLDLK